MVSPNSHDQLALRLSESCAYLRDKIQQPPRVALVLGSGLGDFAEQLSDPIVISSSEIPHYPTSSVPGHASQLAIGSIRDAARHSPLLLVFKGRVHFYESGDLSESLYPIHVAKQLGCDSLIATNAAGGINRKFQPGDLMLISDVINLTFVHPARRYDIQTTKRGQADLKWRSEVGVNLFDGTLLEAFRSSARIQELNLAEGCYCWLKGPSYETAAEIEMLRRLGADAVGMSTVPETMLAQELGMGVAAVSLISNLATGITNQKLSHEEVTETANKVKTQFTKLMREVVLRLA